MNHGRAMKLLGERERDRLNPQGMVRMLAVFRDATKVDEYIGICDEEYFPASVREAWVDEQLGNDNSTARTQAQLDRIEFSLDPALDN